MDSLVKFFIIFLIIYTSFRIVNAETYTVKVNTDSHINVVDSRFLSFTIDPEHLFTSNEKFNSKECGCMASALTPAFIRIAGQSTAHLTFKNTSITITEPATEPAPSKNPPLFSKLNLGEYHPNSNLVKRATTLGVSHRQWKKFVEWSNQTGFDIVFALNHQQKLSSGAWDPYSAMSILSVAEKADVSHIVWQLGYECSNQSIDEYLYDLETLRLMVDSFPQGVTRQWRVIGGDVTPCLQEYSKSDFKDYVTLSNERLDAIVLDGKSSTRELEKLSNKDRMKLLQLLSRSETPLWITEGQLETDLEDQDVLRAADWLKSLGQSARNGFSVHFRELIEDELFKPSLSFYMALLFKNLVGERVLNAEIDAPTEKTSLFAHCTSLHHKTVPGAVTLFAVNMDDETARFSIKLSRREDGGDIMQFILGLDSEGNIMVNGRAMYYEGDIRPVVKRVRPYKTLLLSLPPKSFGFWVLAKTKIDACYDAKPAEKEDKQTTTVVEDKFEEHNLIRTKRSKDQLISEPDYPDFDDVSDEVLDFNAKRDLKGFKVSEALNERVENLNRNFKNMRSLLKRTERTSDNDSLKDRKLGINKRQVDDSYQGERIQDKIKHFLNRDMKVKKPLLLVSKDKNFLKTSLMDDESKPKEGILVKIIRLNAKLNETRQLRNEKGRKLNLPLLKNNVNREYLEKSKPNLSIKEIGRKKFQEIVEKRKRDIFKRHSNVENAPKEEITHKNYNEDHLINKIDHKESAEGIEKNTRDFAKRNLNTRTEEHKQNNLDIEFENDLNEPTLSRRRRSILDEKRNLKDSKENEIDTEGFKKFGKILHKINQQLEDLPAKLESNRNDDENESEGIEEQITLQTKITDDDSVIKLSEKSSTGLLKATFSKAVSVLEDLNAKLNRLMSAMTILH